MGFEVKTDVRFHCSKRADKAATKSKHRVHECCDDVRKVLAANPQFGCSIPGHGDLRKMRVAVPSCRMSKRDGYRAIYQAEMIEQTAHIVFLDTYFKGDKEDLSKSEYDALLAEASAILSDPLSYEWEDFLPTH